MYVCIQASLGVSLHWRRLGVVVTTAAERVGADAAEPRSSRDIEKVVIVTVFVCFDDVFELL